MSSPSFKPADILTLSFLILLSIITVCVFPSGGMPVKLLTTYLALAAALVALILSRRRTANEKTGALLYTALTVVIISVIFNSLGELIAEARSRTYDDMLIKIDFALFGVHPTVWMERTISPIVTVALQLAYISYYFIPVSVAIVLIAKTRYKEYEDALFGIILCFYLSYIGYLLVPAVGPRFTLDHFQTAGLQAGPFVKTIQDTLNGLEKNKTDAFPSGHTAVALMSLYYSWKLKEGLLFKILLPLAMLLMVSTVYLRYHYVIDVIAGIALTALTVFLAPPLYRCFSGAGSKAQGHSHGSA